MKTIEDKKRFLQIWIGVAVAHLAIISIMTLMLTIRPKRPKMEMIQLLPQGVFQPSKPPQNDTGTLQQKLKSVSPPQNTQKPTPPSEPKPQPQEPSLQKPDPPSKPTSATQKPSLLSQPNTSKVETATAPSKPPVKPVKVSLKEITRETTSKSTTTSTKSSSKPANNVAPSTEDNEGVDAANLKERLVERLGKAGVQSASADGGSGIPTGQLSQSAAAHYFGLIRDVYYRAWHQPISLSGQKLSTILKIRVSKSGEVLNAQIEQSSSNPIMDQSVMEAARSVKSIGTPLPDALGSQFADISVVFEF